MDYYFINYLLIYIKNNMHNNIFKKKLSLRKYAPIFFFLKDVMDILNMNN